MKQSLIVLSFLIVQAPFLGAQEKAPNWVKVTDQAGWQPRDSQGEVVYQDHLWILGGWYNGRLPGHSASSEVWSSSDGVKWQQATDNAGWSPRIAAGTVVFQDK